MLYSTHCIACHTAQAHWREERLATDWRSLKKQVTRWERNAGLNWNDEDISAVTHYLNSLYYHFPAERDGKKISSRESITNARETGGGARSRLQDSDR